jgi:imidazoleglycerol phosphate synthase glutamine amidotransferase subunit HisH
VKVAVLDCGSGNLASATRALQRAAADEGITATVALTRALLQIAPRGCARSMG